MSRRYGIGRSRRFGPGREYLRLDPHGLDPTPHGETRSPGTTTHYTPGKPPTTVSNTSPGRHPSIVRTEPGGQEVPSYVPKPPPVRHSARPPRYSGSNPIAYLADLITPGPTAHETAAAAQRLGVKPQQAAPEAAGQAASGILHTISEGVNTLSQDAAKVATAPSQRVHSFLGRRTLGTPTANQLLQAAHKGTERVNRKGRLTIPATRHAAKGLAVARNRVANSGANPAALAKQFPELTPAKIRALGEAQRRTGTPAALLAGILSKESDFGRSTLPGVHSGQNFAGAAGPYQIGNGTGASGDAWQQVAQELWGPNASKHSIYNFRDASLAAGQYLQTFPSTPATKNPATWYDAALSYNHAGWYAEAVKREALARRALNKAGMKPDPKAVEALAKAKFAADRLGIPTKSAGGDVEHAPGTHTVFVRADAKGFVQWAKALLGTQEGSRLQLKWANEAGITAAEPWCAAFITAGILRRGMTPPPGSANSQSWMTWKEGTNIGTDVRKAKPGDIIVIGEGDHIGLYVGGGKMIAGNWSNEVSEYPVAEDTRGVEGIIRPHFKGGKVAVKESAVLPGAGIGPAGEIVSGPAGVGGVGGAAATGSPQQRGAGGGSYGGVSLRPLNPLISTAGDLLTPGEQAAAAQEEGEGEPEGIVQAILRRRRP